MYCWRSVQASTEANVTWCEWLSHHVAEALINEVYTIRCHCFAFGLRKQTYPVLTTRVSKLKFFPSLLPDILLITPFISVRSGIFSQDCQVSERRLFHRPTMSRYDRWDDDLKELGKCHCVSLPSSPVHNRPTALSRVLHNSSVEIKRNANSMQLGDFFDVFLARNVSGTYAHHQEH